MPIILKFVIKYSKNPNLVIKAVFYSFLGTIYSWLKAVIILKFIKLLRLQESVDDFSY